MPFLCIPNDRQYYVLWNTKPDVKIYDECWFWIIMLIDLLLNHPFQRRWNSLRTFLPIINAFAGRNTGLIFIAPSARLLDNLGNLNT